jgi:hypothetical protein
MCLASWWRRAVIDSGDGVQRIEGKIVVLLLILVQLLYFPAPAVLLH